MGSYNIVNPDLLVTGKPEDVSQVLANFQAIAAIINGGLDNSNLTADAAIAISKLALFPNNAGVYLRGDGTWAAVSGTGVLMPTGAIFPYIDATPPSGFDKADGHAISRTGVGAALFAIVGTRFGAGDGSTTYNLPNIADKIPVGQGSAFATIGALGGEANHALTAAEMPAHSHVVNSHAHGGGNHAHTFARDVFSLTPGSTPYALLGATHDVSVDASGNTIASEAPGTNVQGSSAQHNNMPPYIVLPYVIKL